MVAKVLYDEVKHEGTLAEFLKIDMNMREELSAKTPVTVPFTTAVQFKK